MRGLVLEGGGAKGAYQIGAYKALLELGYTFDYIVGTSIGAVNGVMFVQDKVEIAEAVWKDITFSTVVEADDKRLDFLMNKEISIDNFLDKLKIVKDIISDGGFDTTPFKQLLDIYVDEEKVRNSKTKFGLVTVDITNRKPIEIFIDEMPKNTLKDYLYASSNLPVFRQEPIDGRYFLDGGFYSNNPVKMLEDKCDEIINIVLYPKRLRDLFFKENGKIKVIMPREDLTDILNFNKEWSEYGINLGYYDVYKKEKNLLGNYFYIEDFSEEDAIEYLVKYYRRLNEDKIFEAGLKDFLEEFMPKYRDKNKLPKETNYSTFLVYAVEKIGVILNIKRFQIYKIHELAKLIEENEKFEMMKNNEEFLFETKLIEVLNEKKR